MENYILGNTGKCEPIYIRRYVYRNICTYAGMYNVVYHNVGIRMYVYSNVQKQVSCTNRAYESMYICLVVYTIIHTNIQRQGVDWCNTGNPQQQVTKHY
jgi:hypothetical protein